jgi:hydrogenase maturation protease
LGFEFEVVLADATPERHLTHLTDGAFDRILFLDAVDFGAGPGAVVLLDADEIKARFPQISTHRISLGLLAQLVEAGAPTKVRLLGVQPESLKPGPKLSPAVEATLPILRDLLLDLREDKERSRPEGCAMPC